MIARTKKINWRGHLLVYWSHQCYRFFAYLKSYMVYKNENNALNLYSALKDALQSRALFIDSTNTHRWWSASLVAPSCPGADCQNVAAIWRLRPPAPHQTHRHSHTHPYEAIWVKRFAQGHNGSTKRARRRTVNLEGRPLYSWAAAAHVPASRWLHCEEVCWFFLYNNAFMYMFYSFNFCFKVHHHLTQHTYIE